MSTIIHPSNVLHNGEVESFEHAMRLVVDECDYEAAAQRRFAAELGLEPLPNDPVDENLRSSLDAYKIAANVCLAEYREVIGKAAQQLFEKWKNSPDSNIKMIGEAAAAGDYSSLAI